ncbi:MAG: histidine kinase [Salinivirgaceae bacterium]
MRKYSKKNWLVYLLLGSIGAIVGYLFQPNATEKYVGRLMSDTSQILADGQKNLYKDIDGDGNSEEIIYYHLSDSRQPVINLYNSDGVFQNAWYLEGEVVEYFEFIWGDCNLDSLNEVYVFSKTNDWVYLYCLIPLNIGAFELEKIPVCKINESDGNSHLVIHSGGVADLNNDGFKEVVFTINSRFSEQPRSVFAYDCHNKKMKQSPEIEMQLVGSPILYDINKDGSPEIFLSTFNSTNQGYPSRKQPLNSASIVLNSDLSYYSHPLLYESRMSISSVFPWESPDGNFIVSLSWSLSENGKARIQLLKQSGELISQNMVTESNFIFDPARSDWSKILAFHRDGWVIQYLEDGTVADRIDLKGMINQVAYFDIDENGIDEVMVVQSNRLTILRNDFSHPVVIDIPELSIEKIHFSIKNRKGLPNFLSIQNEHHQFLIYYSENQFYWFRFVLYALSIFTFLFAYWLFLRLHHIQLQHIKYTNEKFYKMQLDLIRNQLDPHFLFNALNSIAFSINTEDRKTAYNNLGLFSKFLREAIVSLDEFSRSLEEELDYVKNYMVLEKFRFKEKFTYDFIVSPGINKSVKVPKLIVFSFVESALKKGVLVKNIPGTIQIMVDMDENQNIYIQIADDGVFRDLEKSESSFTKNMLMIEQVIAYFNSFNSNKITIQYSDKGSPEESKGSLVTITIPADYSYLI